MTDLRSHYSRLYAQYGDDPRAVQLADQETQRRRFDVLLGVAPALHGASLLDVGCGLGHLGEYLDEQHAGVAYSGIDITPPFVDACRNKFPSGRFELHDIAQAPPPWKADFLVVNGVFNNLRDDAEEFLKASVRHMYEACNVGIAFNAMSRYVDFLDPQLVYFDPEELFAFCKTSLSPRVTLRHDYQVRADVVPFEFTLYVYKTSIPVRPKLRT